MTYAFVLRIILAFWQHTRNHLETKALYILVLNSEGRTRLALPEGAAHTFVSSAG